MTTLSRERQGNTEAAPRGREPDRPGGIVRAGSSGRLLALTKQTTALALGKASPHAVALARHNGVLEAHLAHRAEGANSFRLLGLFLRERVEDLGVESSAGRSLAPRGFHQPVAFSRSVALATFYCRCEPFAATRSSEDGRADRHA